MKTVLVMLFSLFSLGITLNCYTCSVGEQDADRTCVDQPENVSITVCNKNYCTIIRQEYKDTKTVASIFRGCEDNPLHLQEIIEDNSYRFYYTACQKDLCNGGSGKLDSMPLPEVP